MQDVLACAEEEMQADLRFVRGATAVCAAAQPTAEPEPSSAVSLAAAALALAAVALAALAAAAAVAAAIRAAYATRLPEDRRGLLHDRERLLRRRPHLDDERVQCRRHSA